MATITTTWSAAKPIIALDADGVLLDYGSAYPNAWKRAFRTFPREIDATAYWPLGRPLRLRWLRPFVAAESLTSHQDLS